MKKIIFALISFICAQAPAGECISIFDQLISKSDTSQIDILISNMSLKKPLLTEFDSPQAQAILESRQRSYEALNLSKVIWYFDGANKKGIYKSASPSRFTGDRLEIVSETSSDKKILREYYPETRIESFNLSPDGKFLVALLLQGAFLENRDQLFYSTSAKISEVTFASPSGFYKVFVEIINLPQQKVVGEVLLSETDNRIYSQSSRTNYRHSIFSALTVTNQEALLEPLNWVLSLPSARVTWNRDGNEGISIKTSPLFQEKFKELGKQSQTYQLTMSQNGNVIAATVSLFDPSVKEKIVGVAIRNLNNDPIQDNKPLFESRHVFLKFEGADSRANPRYMFSPNGDRLFIIGEMGGVTLVKNILKAPQAHVLDLDKRLLVRSVAFSKTESEFVITGLIDTTRGNPEHPEPSFYKTYSMETLQPIFKNLFYTDVSLWYKPTFSNNGQVIGVLSFDKKFLFLLDAFKGQIIKKYTFPLSAFEHISDFWFSADDTSITVATSHEKVLKVSASQTDSSSNVISFPKK